jgi:hypothetical protein
MSDFDQPRKGQRGGKRIGSGRRAGSRNKETVYREKEVALTGATPLQVMLKTMRYHYAEATTKMKDKNHDRKEVSVNLEAAMRAAKSCADYVHPKLASVVSKVDTTLTQAADVTDARSKLENMLGTIHTGTTSNGTLKPN